MTIRLMLVDDHIYVRLGLRMLLEAEADMQIVGEAGSGQEAIQLVRDVKPDVILLDIGLPDLSGIEVARQIKASFPAVAVVALTIHEDAEYFFRMLQAGASGYVPKRAAPTEVMEAVRAAARDEVYIYPSLAKLLVQDVLNRSGKSPNEPAPPELTPREQEVIAQLADGVTIDEIAEKLVISPKTVARHRENIMQKLNLHSRAALVKYAIRKGIIKA
jgi:two-component system response regulator NreC